VLDSSCADWPFVVSSIVKVSRAYITNARRVLADLDASGFSATVGDVHALPSRPDIRALDTREPSRSDVGAPLNSAAGVQSIAAAGGQSSSCRGEGKAAGQLQRLAGSAAAIQGGHDRCDLGCDGSTEVGKGRDGSQGDQSASHRIFHHRQTFLITQECKQILTHSSSALFYDSAAGNRLLRSTVEHLLRSKSATGGSKPGRRSESSHIALFNAGLQLH